MYKLLSAFLLLSLFMNTASASGPTLVPQAPQLGAKAYLLQDFTSGRDLAQHRADERMAPASLTKLMSAYVIFEALQSGRLRPDENVRVSEKAWRMTGSRTFIEVGTSVSVETLLKGMIVQSGNDATVALAEHLAGSESVFVSLMNQKAQELGLANSQFANSTGLPDENHFTTPRDLATLTRHLITQFPEYYQWYSMKEFSYNGITQYNRNKLLWRDERVDGVKTGHTDEAGYCLISSAKEGEMRLLSVVMGTNTKAARANDSQSLLSYGFRFFDTHKLYAAGATLKTARVWKGASEELALGLNQDLFVTIPSTQYDQLSAAVQLQPQITAPVQAGQKLGQVTVSLNGEVIAEQSLVALQTVEESGFFGQIMDEVQLWFE